jgi:hypothetical protein
MGSAMLAVRSFVLRYQTVVLLALGLYGCSAPTDPPAPVAPAPPSDPSDTAVGLSPPIAEVAAPVTALLEIVQVTPKVATLSVSANAGFVEVIGESIAAQAGDRLRIRGQVEWTNDFASPVAGLSELRVDGHAVGPETYQNNVQLGTHHSALYQSASVLVSTDGAHRVALRFSAARQDASPTVTVEAAEYTQLVIEHYREYPSLSEAVAAGAHLLRSVAEDHATTLTTYGAVASQLEKIYQVTAPARKGDLVRLSAQTTSGWNAGNPQLFEMHGTSIHVDGKSQVQLSAWASENTPFDVNVTPLWTDGSYVVPADGSYAFDVTMHGVFGVGGLVEGAGGHLAALVFSQAIAADASVPQLSLALSETTTATKDQTHTANSPRLTVLRRDLTVPVGAIVRLEGTLELAMFAGAHLSPSCDARLSWRDAAGKSLESASANKYLTTDLASIALRTELVLAPEPTTCTGVFSPWRVHAIDSSTP